MEETARSEPERSGRRPLLRKAGLVALVLAGLVVVGYLAVGLLLHTMADPDRLARWTERRLEASLNRDVEVGSVRLGVFPRLEVEVDTLRVDNPPDFDAPPFAEVERVSLGVALLPLLRRRVEVDDASVSGATVRLRILEDGRSNFGDFVPAEGEESAAEPEGEAAFRAEVGRVELAGVTVAYRNDTTGLRAEARDVEGEGALGEPSGETRPLELRLEAAELSASGLPGGRSLAPRAGELRLRGEAGGDLESVRIEDGELRLGAVRVGLAGRVDSLRSPVRRLDLRLSADDLAVEDLLALAEGLTPAGEPDAPATGADGGAAALDSLRPSGALDLDLGVRGALGPDRRPTVDGRVTIREGGLAAPGRPPLARDLEGEVRIGTDSLRIERLGGRLLDGALEASGAVAVDSPRAFRLSVTASPRLEAWARAVPGAAEDGELAGSLGLELTVRGRPGDVAGTRATGTVRPEGVRLRRPGWRGDLAFPAGSLRLTGDGLSGSGVPVVAAGDTLRADLELSGLFSTLAGGGAVPRLTSEVRGPRLDLHALLGREAADSVTYGRLAFARLGGRQVAGRTPEELAAREGFRRPDALPVEGTVRAVLGRVIWGPYRMDDVELEARLSPDRLEITRSRLATFGGRAEGTFTLQLGPDPLAPFSLQMDLEGVEASQFLSILTPLGAVATGTTSFSLATSGRLDTLLLPVSDELSGDGRMEARDGQVRENPLTTALARTLSQPTLRAPGFARWILPFQVRGEGLQLPQGQFTGGSLPVDFAGSVGYGGALQMAVTVELPRKAASSLADRVGGLPSALLQRVAGGQGSLPVGLGLGGTLTDPQVTLQADALRQALRSAAKEEAAGQLEQRAKGLLRNILGGERDTVRADTAGAPPDSAGTRR